MKVLLMLVRREFWEHRVLWITPLVLAALLLVAILVFGSSLRVDIQIGRFQQDLADPTMLFGLATLGLGSPFYIAAAILVVVYLLDCLYTERRDRSVLFWKSLPVSDRAVVLSKLLVGMVIVPLGYWACAAVTTLLASGLLALRGGEGLMRGAVPVWDSAGWLRAQVVILYGTIATVLWYAPYGAYMMLVSAWARRSVYAWAVVPPVMVAVIERMLFGTSYLGQFVTRGFSEVLGLAFRVNRQIEVAVGDAMRGGRGGGPGGRGGGGGGGFLQRLDPTDLLNSPQLWIGLAATALMVWLAVVLRRRGEEG